MKAFTSLKTVAALNGGQTSPFYLEIKYLVVVLRCVHLGRQWSQERTGKVPIRTGTDVEMLTSYTLSAITEQKGLHLPRQIPFYSRWSIQCW